MNLSCQNPTENFRQRLPEEFYAAARKARRLEPPVDSEYTKKYAEYRKTQHELILKMIGNSQTDLGDHILERERVMEPTW